jgi:hypothetical protein
MSCRRGREPRTDTRTASAAPSSKRAVFPARSAFYRRIAHSVPAFTVHLERGPATDPRVLPPAVGFRRSFALRYDEEGLDPAAFASSSPASARCHAPLVDFCNRNDPQARPGPTEPARDFAPAACAPSVDTEGGSPSPFGAAKPSAHGSGAGYRFAGFRLSNPSTSRRACARRELRPNPIGSDTSCRGPAIWPAGVAGSMLSNPPGDHRVRDVRPRDALSLRLEQGRLPRPSAKKDAFRCTRGAFLCRNSPQGRALVSPSCPQPVDSGPGASSIPADPLPST